MITAKFDKQKNKWRILIPPSITGTGKRAARFFDSREQAEAAARDARFRGLNPAKDLTQKDKATLAYLKQRLGEKFDLDELVHALDRDQRLMEGVNKHQGKTLEEACKAFMDRQRHEAKNIRTIYSDQQALKYLCDFVGYQTKMVEVSEFKLNEYFASMPPGGRRRTQYARVKKFISWAFRGGWLGIDPLAKARPLDRWNSNKKILDVEDFRRILYVCAGLEPAQTGGHCTTRFIRLLPFYVLGGLAGLRRCELVSSDPSDPVIEWSDIYWSKNLVHVRDEVAKQTGATDRRRYPSLEPAAADWLRLVAKPSGPIITISQSTLQRLQDELFMALNHDAKHKVRVPSNGLRNSYASYRQSFDSPGEVAKAMGDNESTVRRYYIKTIEPGTGHAWFGIRPDLQARKIVPMETAQRA
jgi:hypothetical protein